MQEKKIADKNIVLNEMVVQRKIILKYQRQMKNWEQVKHNYDLLELKKDKYNQWSHSQLNNMLLFFKSTEDGPLSTTNKYLIKLWIECSVTEYIKEEQ